ncbi:TonB-linked outer membrane protein, SusC/RagA family [Salinimicrobium catena]|uniref:TonB-linked outer membrane protein, SusC/RagA family n=1 Tax=Salinimicrobium catena TaxID=390640 RepID=A0A1H5K1Q5_9FLAO|nr:SusC/RagA family TonB-linked outer membrane protein [Salinimicrobium catena]SDK92693.1 TonB-linked outer membrane protein, SusC/RagA family [Salinimicrobium catena]SEE58417.1 TonB-linked outer membrane protein, SusC/RagA family [Salinimicrobium catena]
MKQRLHVILTFFMALVVQITFAQDRTVTGTVTDGDGMPLPGVNVLVKGTTSGTQTDFDGNYSVQASMGDILVFSYVGFETKQEVVEDEDVIDVTMVVDAAQLEEVVVTGVAGATSRKKLSVTVGKVDASDLEVIPSTSAASALQGKVAGVNVTNFGQPGSGSTIQLRGATNLFGGQEPLILVDGVQVEGGINDINSDDIASFEIVKGASASALYGSRAGNGVIVITTKRGKYNADGPVVTLRNDLGLSELANKIDLNKSHAYQLADDWEQYQGQYTRFAGVTYADDYSGVGRVGVSGARIPVEDDVADNPYGVYYDNQDLFFGTGVDNTTYASVSNASEFTNVFFSADRTENEGIFAETGGYKRYGVRLNGDFQINDWLKLSTNNNYIRSNNETPGGTLDGVIFDLALTSPDVNLNAPNPDGQPYYFIPDPWAATTINPLYGLATNRELATRNRFLGSYNLNIEFTDWLNLDTEYAVESTHWVNDDYNPYTAFQVGGMLGGENVGFSYSKGDFSKESSYTLSQKGQATLNYVDSFGDLNVAGKLSYLMEDIHYEYYYGLGQDFIYQGVISLDNFDSALTRVSSNSTDERAQNAFAILGLDYKDRYIVDAMYRIDGSSLFGENHRWNDYYRVSGAYRISQDFNIPGITEFKIHAALGTAGQRPGFSWQYDMINLTTGSLATNRIKSNPDLKPSTTTELEFGANLEFLQRFTFEGVYAKSETEDQFMLVDIFAPANEGKNRQWQNVGTVEFNTLELSLTSAIIDKQDLGWDFGIRYSRTRNEITNLNVDPITVGPGGTNTPGVIFRVKEGEEFGAMYGNAFVTSLEQMENQLPEGTSINDFVVNRDGVVVRRDAVGTSDEAAIIRRDENGDVWYGKIGSQNADFQMGFTSNLRYKGFNFYMLWDWKNGGDIYNRQGQWLTRDNRHAMMDQAGVPAAEQKTQSYYQSLYAVNGDYEYWVEDGSYVKLREASLFYTLGKDQLAGVANGFFDSLRLGVTGRNLLTFTDYSGWDPEVQRYDANTQNYYAVDYGVYPVSRGYNLSVQLKF